MRMLSRLNQGSEHRNDVNLKDLGEDTLQVHWSNMGRLSIAVTVDEICLIFLNLRSVPEQGEYLYHLHHFPHSPTGILSNTTLAPAYGSLLTVIQGVN